MAKQISADFGSEAAKAAPPIAVVTTTAITGMSLQDWVLVATLAYIALQAAWILWKWYRAWSTKGWTPHDD